MEMLQDS